MAFVEGEHFYNFNALSSPEDSFFRGKFNKISFLKFISAGGKR